MDAPLPPEEDRPSDSGSDAPSLHPLLLHHILNTLGWTSLRPLQKAAVAPITSGAHVLLAAPTAGGKTEAAIFPVLSRILTEEWNALSVLYLCPLRALLNNLHPRIEHYAELVGRKAGLWHGDTVESAREWIRTEPPDILLTTPESVEAMLVSGKTHHASLFRNVQAVIVDEVHAFAGDDRGWHLLAVTERLQRLCGREIQRIGLSATVGNPEDILEWMSRTGGRERVVVAPTHTGARRAPNLTLDYVGSLENAATVISRMHRGEKRLAFVDSRARVEELAVALRDRGVETYVSHGSLGRSERHAAEKAFAESRDCVIVATSTLELGIDVGDLDRVIQIDAAPTVAGFLQRLGRTGRRGDEVSNTLILATKDEAFLHALGVLRCWEEGYVEPLEPARLPLHLVVQQVLALVLQERGVGRRTWRDWFGEPFVLGSDVEGHAEELVNSLVENDFLFEDNGILGIGERGRRTFGGRHFMDLMAVFSEPPMLKVLAGRIELGQVPQRLLTRSQPDGHILLLAGRDWTVLDIDWKRGVVRVEPAVDRGKVRWFGEGRGLSFAVCQGLKRTLADGKLTGTRLSDRAVTRLEEMRDKFSWISAGEDLTLITGPESARHLWTFAGSLVNTWLALSLKDLADQRTPGDLGIRLADGIDPEAVQPVLRALRPEALSLTEEIESGAVDRLKFGEALPEHLAQMVVERRMREDELVRKISKWSVRIVSGAG